MKKRLCLQKLAISFAVVMGFMFLGCEIPFDNEFRNQEDLYAKFGGVVIYNISNTETIESVLVKNMKTGEEIPYKDDNNNGLVKPNEALLVALGTEGSTENYTLTVKYPEKSTNPMQGKTFSIEWKKKVAWYVSSAPINPDKGLLQVINFSGTDVISVKVDSSELIDLSPIKDKERRSFSQDPGDYSIQVDINNGGPNFPAKKDIKIVANDVINIIVFSDGIEIGIPDTEGTQNNLWVLNRAGSSITNLEKKLENAAYESLGVTLPVASGKAAGKYLAPGKYHIRATLEGKSPFMSEQFILDKEPVFLVVYDNDIEIVSGDSDRDGFPDWWEDMYFGEDAKNDPNVPSKEGDADGDGLSNWDEFERGTNPVNPDTDGDGLTDWEEVNGEIKAILPGRPEGFPAPGTKFPPTDPTNTDTDGDDYGDFIEVRDNTNPVDPNSIPKITIVIPWGH